MVELGTKFVCFSCEAKFYDMGRPEPICPKCGANQKDAGEPPAEPEPRARSSKKRPVPRKAVDGDDSGDDAEEPDGDEADPDLDDKGDDDEDKTDEDEDDTDEDEEEDETDEED